VDSLFDACIMQTDADISNPADEEVCLGFQGNFASLASSPNGNLLAIVPQDPTTFERTNELWVIDLAPGGTGVTYTLDAPTRDGSPASTLLFADALQWNASGDTVFFDALNELPLPGGGSTLRWSIYALDRASGAVFDVVSPLPNADFDFPALGHTSDDFITFDAIDGVTGSSTIYAGNLVTGNLAAVDTVAGREGVPGFAGDDLALVYSRPATNTTGSSLFRHALAADHMTPVGTRMTWITNADFGVIYRRGAFAGPPPDLDLDGIPDTTDNCPFEANPGQADGGGVVGVGDACECGDLGTNGQVGDDDVTSLRNWLARAPVAVPALQRCSVRGGIECDVADFATLQRARLGLQPGVAQSCAAASEL
ncbi:MAG: thrombospondin type 3 repeat-containing protein, partial [Solirubrobacteraceae bacterium]